MKEIFKQLLVMLIATTLLVAGLPAIEARAAEKSVTITTATNAVTEYRAEPFTISAGFCTTYGLAWSRTSSSPFKIEADSGVVITKIEALVGHVSTDTTSITLAVSSGSVSPETFGREIIDRTITIENINSSSVIITPSSPDESPSLQLKEFTVYYDLVHDSVRQSHTHNYEWKIISEPTESQDGMEGYVCSCGATKEVSYTTAASVLLRHKIDQVKNAPVGSVTRLEMNSWNSLPKSFMSEIENNRKGDIIMVINYNQKKCDLSIPYTQSIDTSCDWYGPAKLMSLYAPIAVK